MENDSKKLPINHQTTANLTSLKLGLSVHNVTLDASTHKFRTQSLPYWFRSPASSVIHCNKNW